jgi:predicted nucleic acid-binding protein
MAQLIDTSLWIDLTRLRSPGALKAFVAPYINDPEADLADPITFELLRFATDAEASLLTQYFANVPKLSCPDDLWTLAAKLGQECRKTGITAGAIDLLISTVAIFHSAELVTFDEDFQLIAGASALKVKILKRPVP